MKTKLIYLGFGLWMLTSCKPQELKEMSLLTRRVRIESDGIGIEANLADESVLVKAKMDRVYYWFEKGKISSSQGFFSGKLLDGKYRVYAAENKEIAIAGQFTKGLKTGMWLHFNQNGILEQRQEFMHGKANGLTIAYDSTGKAIDTTRFKDGLLVLPKTANQRKLSNLISRLKHVFKPKGK